MAQFQQDQRSVSHYCTLFFRNRVPWGTGEGARLFPSVVAEIIPVPLLCGGRLKVEGET